MAARENQGYLIAVILLVMATIVLAITTYFGYSTMYAMSDQNDAARKNLAKAEAEAAAWQAQAGMLKAYLGMGGFSISQVSTLLNQIESSKNAEILAEAQSITETYNQDMAMHATTDQSIDENYRNLLAAVLLANSELSSSAAVLNNTVAEMEARLRSELAAKDAELAERDRLLVETREDLAAEQQAHSTTRSELDSKLTAAEQSVQELGNALNTRTATLEQERKTFQEELAARKDLIASQQRQIEGLTQKETDVADGQVVNVSSILDKVVINLGYEDNLRPNQTFSVYDQSKTMFREGEEKAKIEITRILDAHLSEARITNRRNDNPILARDFVMTPTWDPGYSVPIAIAGIIDLDGDARSDLQRLISIVEQNNGDVVAWHDEEGNVHGKIDENTRLFVTGDPPLGAMVDGYEELKRQRDRYQVREISVRELFNEMGYRSEARVQRFDDPDFVPRQPTRVDEGDAFDDDSE